MSYGTLGLDRLLTSLRTSKHVGIICQLKRLHEDICALNYIHHTNRSDVNQSRMVSMILAHLMSVIILGVFCGICYILLDFELALHFTFCRMTTETILDGLETI